MICVDASLAAKWIFPEEYSEQALALLTACTKAGDRIVAPPLLLVEVTNIIRQRMRRHGLLLDDARKLLNQFWAFSVTFVSPNDLSAEALVVASQYDLAAVYDAHYVALARLLNCDCWTNDQRLLKTLDNRLPFVKWIGSYEGHRGQGIG